MSDQLLNAIVTDNFKLACELFLKEGMQEEDYRYAEELMLAAIAYFNTKRAQEYTD